jgi:hypothetical protein
MNYPFRILCVKKGNNLYYRIVSQEVTHQIDLYQLNRELAMTHNVLEICNVPEIHIHHGIKIYLRGCEDYYNNKHKRLEQIGNIEITKLENLNTQLKSIYENQTS